MRRAIHEAGLEMGRDVSVITHDDDFSYLSNGRDVPIFTATRSPVREAGRIVGDLVTGGGAGGIRFRETGGYLYQFSPRGMMGTREPAPPRGGRPGAYPAGLARGDAAGEPLAVRPRGGGRRGACLQRTRR